MPDNKQEQNRTMPNIIISSALFQQQHLYDPATIDRLRVVLKDKFCDVITMSQLNMQTQGERMAAAQDRNDRETVRNLAHSMVSSAGVFGMMKLAAMARKLEYGGDNWPDSEWRSLHDKLQETLRASLDALSQIDGAQS